MLRCSLRRRIAMLSRMQIRQAATSVPGWSVRAIPTSGIERRICSVERACSRLRWRKNYHWPDSGNSGSMTCPLTIRATRRIPAYDTTSYAQPIEASDPPPPLPDYSQPDCPGRRLLLDSGAIGVRPPAVITGFPAHGCWRPFVNALLDPALLGCMRATSLPLALPVTGQVLTSASMAASTMVSVIPGAAITARTGITVL